MIILIVGDFGVGKDTFADFLSSYLPNSKKIQSYTTRKPRYEGEDTHIFCYVETIDDDLSEFDKDKFFAEQEFCDDEWIAHSVIGNNVYWTEKHQFDKNKYNIYVVDTIGLHQVISSDLDTVISIEILRDKSLIDVDEKRLSRSKEVYTDYKKYIDITVNNNGDLHSLKEFAKHIAELIHSI